MTEDDKAAEEAVAREILASCLGTKDPKLERQEGGLSNCVFQAKTPDGPVIIRMGQGEEKSEAFAREHKAIIRVAEAGVPVPKVMAQGEHESWAYMIAHKAPGQSATDHPKRLDVLRDLACIAAETIHRIPTLGFGKAFTFDATCDEGGDWRGWIERELDAANRLDLLRTHQVITEEQRATFLESVEALKGWTGQSVLNHGDLRLKNVLVDDEGGIEAVIDWDLCLSSLGPHWDLSIALHDLSVDQKEAFIEGYGLTAEEVREFSPFWRLYNALNYAPELERIVEAGDKDALDKLRIRFSGSLDLYAEPESSG